LKERALVSTAETKIVIREEVTSYSCGLLRIPYLSEGAFKYVPDTGKFCPCAAKAEVHVPPEVNGDSGEREKTGEIFQRV
jgi:hypothetical protein